MDNENTFKMKGSNLVAETDPTGHYNQLLPDLILESLGIVPIWLACQNAPTFKERIELNYQFMGEWNNKADFAEDGTRTYPGDPADAPVAKFTDLETGEICYMYKNAWIAVKCDGNWIVTKVD